MADKIQFNEESKTTAYEKEIIMSYRCGTTCKKNLTILQFSVLMLSEAGYFPKQNTLSQLMAVITVCY